MKNKKFIDKKQLLKNLEVFQDKQVCAMVKANAYGHGLSCMVELLREHVACFGVVSAQEGSAVRRLTDKPILVCAKTRDFDVCRHDNLEFIVESKEDILLAEKFGLADKMHLKIDCGMNRYGVKNASDLEEIDALLSNKNIQLKSICTHFPETSDFQKTQKNYEKFQFLREKIRKNCKICFGGSGIHSYSFAYDMLRVGIGLYGYEVANVRPVMSICSYVSKIFYAQSGECVGYGSTFRVQKNGFFAVVPVGYADGLRRNLSGKFCVEISGKKFLSFGNICMDAFFVEVDDTVRVGDQVKVMTNAEELAKISGTISYEILTGFSNFRGLTEILQ